jgi:UrcA family protein
MTRLFALCLALTLCAAPAAFADPPAASVTVRSDDLDLSTERGAAFMLRRLEAAADQVCGRSVAERYPGTRDDYETCRAATLSAAVSRLNAPALGTAYAQRYGDTQVAAR